MAEFAGSEFTPSLSFGAPLPSHIGGVFSSPSQSEPDIEFSILDFEGLPLSSGFDSDPNRFSFTAFVGSFSDDGIGEDFIPGAGAHQVVEFCQDADEDGFSTCEGDCDDGDASINPGTSLCDSKGKPDVLHIRYTGNNCDESVNDQGAKFVCSGDTNEASPVRLVASNRSTLDDSRARIWFDGTVSVGDEFFFDAANGNAHGLNSNTYVHVVSPEGALLQSITFHTSCSKPLEAGDSFGSVLVLGTEDPTEGRDGTCE